MVRRGESAPGRATRPAVQMSRRFTCQRKGWQQMTGNHQTNANVAAMCAHLAYRGILLAVKQGVLPQPAVKHSSAA